jgi:peptidoglycan hydrolase CwlO-like protein
MARGRRGRSKAFFTWLLLLLCIVLAVLAATYAARASRLERQNGELRTKLQHLSPQPNVAELQKKVQQLQRELDAKDQQLGDLQIRLKIYEKGSVKK